MISLTQVIPGSGIRVPATHSTSNFLPNHQGSAPTEYIYLNGDAFRKYSLVERPDPAHGGVVQEFRATGVRWSDELLAYCGSQFQGPAFSRSHIPDFVEANIRKLQFCQKPNLFLVSDVVSGELTRFLVDVRLADAMSYRRISLFGPRTAAKLDTEIRLFTL